MANGASRIFDVMKSTNNNDNSSSFVNLKVKTLSPLTFMLGDKSIITEDFYVLDINFDTSILAVGDIVKAIVLNNNQLYYILCNVNLLNRIIDLENS